MASQSRPNPKSFAAPGLPHFCIRIVCGLTLVCGLATQALAQPTPPPDRGTRVSAHFATGVGPFGTVGLAVDTRLNRWMAIEAGVGLGDLGRGEVRPAWQKGVAFGIIPRLLLPLPSWTASIGAGVARAPDWGLHVHVAIEAKERFRLYAGTPVLRSSAEAEGFELYGGVAGNLGEVDRTWYGWQVAAADVVGFLTALASSSAGSVPLALAGTGVYLASAPAVHSLHGQWKRAGLSALLHALLPIMGLEVGSYVKRGDGESDIYQGFMWGVAAATAVDVAFLAWDR